MTDDEISSNATSTIWTKAKTMIKATIANI